LVLICSLAFSRVTHGQSGANNLDSATNLNNLVREVYDLKSTILMFSVTQKTLNRGGDAVGVDLAHIIGQSTVSDQQIERICLILEEAFRWPQLIENTTDRKPDVSLLLLDSSRLRTNNPAARDKISAVRSHLISLYKDSQL
jgi:hypothetical protein